MADRRRWTQTPRLDAKMLKDEIGERLKKRAQEIGMPDLLDKIADETIGLTEEEILPF